MPRVETRTRRGDYVQAGVSVVRPADSGLLNPIAARSRSESICRSNERCACSKVEHLSWRAAIGALVRRMRRTGKAHDVARWNSSADVFAGRVREPFIFYVEGSFSR
jgi:hypothetical protein